ncbi:MAG: topoisomerase DNA-binding C4 zinc finger domain-containing protein, partial [Candidatus Pacearchaeota archaeon]
LYSREYIKGKNIEPTPLGISLISILEKYSPIIIDENLTREFEEDMKIILESKKNFEEKEKRVIEKAKRVIKKIVKNFSENKEKIAEELLSSSDTLLSQKKEENKLDILCPLCRKGNLIISYSKKTRKNFIACSNYPDCKNTYTLPKKGLIKKSEEFCKECGFQKIILLKRNKRPWVFCFNRECSTRKNNSNQKLN